MTSRSNSLGNTCEGKGEEAVAGLTTEKEKVKELSRKRFKSKSPITEVPCPIDLGLQWCPSCAQFQLGVAQGECGFGKNSVLEGQQVGLFSQPCPLPQGCCPPEGRELWVLIMEIRMENHSPI